MDSDGDDNDVVITDCGLLFGKHLRAFGKFAQTRRATENRMPEDQPREANVKGEPGSTFSVPDRERDIDEELSSEMNDRPNRQNSSRNRNQEANGMTNTYDSPEDHRHSEIMAVLLQQNQNLVSIY